MSDPTFVRPDFFNKEQVILESNNKKTVISIKEHADSMLNEFYGLDNREAYLARNKLEEAVMWATKAVCSHQKSVEKENE